MTCFHTALLLFSFSTSCGGGGRWSDSAIVVKVNEQRRCRGSMWYVQRGAEEEEEEAADRHTDSHVRDLIKLCLAHAKKNIAYASLLLAVSIPVYTSAKLKTPYEWQWIENETFLFCNMFHFRSTFFILKTKEHTNMQQKQFCFFFFLVHTAHKKI